MLLIDIETRFLSNKDEKVNIDDEVEEDDDELEENADDMGTTHATAVSFKNVPIVVTSSSVVDASMENRHDNSVTFT